MIVVVVIVVIVVIVVVILLLLVVVEVVVDDDVLTWLSLEVGMSLSSASMCDADLISSASISFLGCASNAVYNAVSNTVSNGILYYYLLLLKRLSMP